MVRIIIDVNGSVNIEHELVDKAVKATRGDIGNKLFGIIDNSWLSPNETRAAIRKLANNLKGV